MTCCKNSTFLALPHSSLLPPQEGEGIKRLMKHSDLQPLPFFTLIKDSLQTPHCRHCQNTLPEPDERFCAQCRKTLRFRPHSPLSKRGQTVIYAATTFNPAIRSLLYRYKFSGQQENVIPLSEILINYWSQLLRTEFCRNTCKNPEKPATDFWITAIPARIGGSRHLHIHAKRFAAHFGYSYFPDLLLWQRETHPQHTLRHRQERLFNLKDAFQAKIPAKRGKTGLNSLIFPPKMKVKRIIVLDDITTTGTTLREAIMAISNASGNSPAYLPPVGLAITELPLFSDFINSE